MSKPTVKSMIQQSAKKLGDKVLNRMPYRDTKTGKQVWRNPILAQRMVGAALNG